MLYILNIESRKLVWSMVMNNEFDANPGQHAAHSLPGGEILVFVNNGDFSQRRAQRSESFSYIGLVDSLTSKFKWKHIPEPAERYFSQRFGAVEKLENGNFLISYLKSDENGAAFEVTDKGRLVWEWTNGTRKSDGAPVPVYRVSRLKREQVEPYLKKWKSFGVNSN